MIRAQCLLLASYSLFAFATVAAPAACKTPERGEHAAQPYRIWTGSGFPAVARLRDVPGMTHRTIHRATAAGYKFLHGAAILEHAGIFYATWANSPVNENGPFETLQGRRSKDEGKTWSPVEMIAPDPPGPQRHSHGVLLVHEGKVWCICSRFGIGTPGRHFPGLQAEAFVLDPASDRWQSKGIVMDNCWPCDQPIRMTNGDWITGGLDRDGMPVVAISRQDDLTRWTIVHIPVATAMKPSFAETTVCSDRNSVLAVIRGGGGIAWIATSEDFGHTWTITRPSNLPMARAKPYLGKLSTGQLYLLFNPIDRDVLAIAVGAPGQMTLNRVWRIRHGKSGPPRFPGRAKSKQWSYPYGYEFNGRLYVVYSIGKENCGLSILPLQALRPCDESP